MFGFGWRGKLEKLHETSLWVLCFLIETSAAIRRAKNQIILSFMFFHLNQIDNYSSCVTNLPQSRFLITFNFMNLSIYLKLS